MPTDPAGNYSPPPSYFVQLGDPVLPVQHNPTVEDIAAALTQRLMRDGRGGMVGNLNFNSFRGVNLADAVADGDAAPYGQARNRANHTGTQPANTITGLGAAATLNVGTAPGTVAAGDDSRILGAVQKTGDETIGGVKTFSAPPVVPVGAFPGDRTAAATTGARGTVEKATDAEVRSSAADRAVMTDHLASAAAFVSLTDAGTVGVDWSAAINFRLTVGGNRTIGNPTNGKPGTTRTIWVDGSGGTERTLSFGNQFLGDLPEVADITDGRSYLVTIMCLTPTHFIATAHRASGTE